MNAAWWQRVKAEADARGEQEPSPLDVCNPLQPWKLRDAKRVAFANKTDVYRCRKCGFWHLIPTPRT